MGRHPSWWDKLKASSFADGVKESDRYVKNAEANAKKAKTHPIDPNRFLDVKYSSTAAQQGYVAAMILVDGFIASIPLTAINFSPDPLTFQSSSKYPTITDEEKANRQSFMSHGLNGRYAYRDFLKLAFSERLAKLFGTVYDKLHIKSHYHQDEDISEYKEGFEALKDFKAEFAKEAKKKLKAAGVAV